MKKPIKISPNSYFALKHKGAYLYNMQHARPLSRCNFEALATDVVPYAHIRIHTLCAAGNN